MIARDILSSLRRRWYVLALALLVAAALAVMLYRDGGGFVAKTVVTFALPATTGLAPDNGTTDESVIAFAGVVAAEVNDGKPPMRYAASDAPYYGAGVRQGVSVGLPNAGGQWGMDYRTATIEIQIVGRTREWVATTQRRLLDEILQTASAQQATADPSEAITAAVEPLTMDIAPVTPSRLSVAAALAALAAAATMVGVWGAVRVDRLFLSPRRRRTLMAVLHAGGGTA